MTDDRYKQIMTDLGFPNSQSLLTALKQVSNESKQEYKATEISVADAMSVIKQAMIDDDPAAPGSYAHGWHCNIAMACYDAMREALDEVPHEQSLLIGNEAASRFMKLCFDVDTKQ